MRRLLFSLVIVVTVLGGALTAKAQSGPADITLTLAGFAVPREAYADLIPLFQAKWLSEKGQHVTFNESYLASGAQSRAIVGGFEADVAALSLEQDITRIQDAGLISGDWRANPSKGFVADSVVVLAVRKGNPDGIKDWADLAQPGVEVITPDPATSGGAQWNLLAALGAAERGKVAGYQATEDDGLKLLGGILKNVSVFDKDGRESFLTFEKGIGTAAITYENEAFAGLAAGDAIDIVYPPSTILIESPIAVVDGYARKHGTLEAAQAFVDFALSPEGQAVFAAHGFRPVDKTVLNDPQFKDKFPAINDLFTIGQFGGWPTVTKDLFGESGKISQLIAAVKG